MKAKAKKAFITASIIYSGYIIVDAYLFTNRIKRIEREGNARLKALGIEVK